MATGKQTKKQSKKQTKPKPIYYKFGRPSKFKKKYCTEIIKYFDIPPVSKKDVVKYVNGRAVVETVDVPNPLPLMDSFAVEVCNVDRTTLHSWCKRYPDFRLAYKKAQALQKKILVYQCSYGHITSSYAVFLTKAITDMNDVSSVDITSGGEKVENVNLTSFMEGLKDKDTDGLQREAQKQIANK